MNANQFDNLLRDLAAPGSRRRFLARIAGVTVGASAALATGIRNAVHAQGAPGDCKTQGERPFEVCLPLGAQCTTGGVRGICCTHIHQCQGLVRRILRWLGILSKCSACVCTTGVTTCPGL